MVEAIKLVGAIFGLVAFLLQVWDKLLAHLHLGIVVQDTGGHRTATLTVENKGHKAKRIHYAGLLLRPAEVPVREASLLLSELVRPAGAGGADGNGRRTPVVSTLGAHPLFTLFRAAPERAVSSNGSAHAWVPLGAFFEDQTRFGNEVVKERVSLEPYLQDAREGVRKVRFIVFVKYPLGIVRWRMTSDLCLPPSS